MEIKKEASTRYGMSDVNLFALQVTKTELAHQGSMHCELKSRNDPKLVLRTKYNVTEPFPSRQHLTITKKDGDMYILLECIAVGSRLKKRMDVF